MDLSYSYLIALLSHFQYHQLDTSCYASSNIWAFVFIIIFKEMHFKNLFCAMYYNKFW